MLEAIAHERVAEAYESLGNATKAAEHYARFTELWKDADPELQPRVRRAQDALRRIMGPG